MLVNDYLKGSIKNYCPVHFASRRFRSNTDHRESGVSDFKHLSTLKTVCVDTFKVLFIGMFEPKATAFSLTNVLPYLRDCRFVL